MISKEFRRVFATRRMLLIFLLFFAVEVFLLVFNEKKHSSYPAAAYKTMWTELGARAKTEDTEAMLKELDLQIQKLSFLNDFVSYGIGEETNPIGAADEGYDPWMFLREEYPDIDLEEVLEQYRAGEISLYTGEFSAERDLYKAVVTEFRNSISYPEYREKLVADAQKMLRFPLFSKPGTYGYRNIEATLAKYNKLSQITVVATPAKSVSVLFQGSVPGIMLLFFALFLCVSLYLEEKEEGTIRITRTCPKGRRALAGTKLVVLFLGILLMQCMLYGVRFLALNEIYGFPDLTRSIQSVSGFSSCVMPVSIAGYFLRIFFFRYVVLCFCAVCMAILCSACNDTKSAFAGIFLLFFVQVVCYYAVSANHTLGAVHFLNLWGMLRFDPIGTYLNLNLFGRPVSCLLMMGFLAGIGLLIGSLAELGLFCRKPAAGKQRRKKEYLDGGKTTSLLLHEGRKILLDQKVLWILLLVLVTQLFRYGAMEKPLSVEELYYQYYMEKLNGPITPEKEQFLEEEQRRFRELHSAKASDFDAQRQLIAENGFRRAYQRYQYLINVLDGEFFYDTGYQYLFAEKNYRADFLLTVTAIALLVLTGASVFGMDAESGMLRLVVTAKNGKKGIRSRLLWGGVVTVLVWLLVYLPDLLQTFRDYGTEGITAPAYSMELLAKAKTMPVWGCLLLLYLIRLLSLFLFGSFVYWVSCKTRSTAVTIFVSLAGFASPALLILLYERLAGGLFFIAPFSGNLLRMYPWAVSGGIVVGYLMMIVLIYGWLVRKKGNQ